MYQALYRKYRPRTFEDVAGQSHVTETLRRQVETGRISHAYLFVGSRGTGKTTCAKILSRALNCENPQHGSPCNHCPSCLGIESGAVMDVVEIDAASNNGVDNIRAIRDEALFTPASVRKRVYIVDEVHMLSQSAFNALLKILEEPPEHLVFILATTELRKIPATILSRCQRFSFKRLMPEDISKRLLYVAGMENIALSESGAALLSRLADGSMRDALSLLDQCAGDGEVTEERVLSSVGLSGNAETDSLFRYLRSGDISAALSLFEKFYFSGRDPSSVLSELLSLVRDMLMTAVAPTASASLLSSARSVQSLSELADGASAHTLMLAADTLTGAASSLSLSKDKRTCAELCLIRLSDTLSGNSPAYCINTPPAQKTAAAPAPAASAPAKKSAPVPPAPVEKKPVSAPSSNAPADTAAPLNASDEPRTIPDGRASASPADFWDGVISALKGRLSPPADSFLADKAAVTPELNGDCLTLYSQNDFIVMMLDTVPVRTAVAEAASSALGKAIAVKVMKGSGTVKKKSDKLSELSKFGNVKFE